MADLKQSAKQTLDQIDLDALKKNLRNFDPTQVRQALGLSNVDVAQLHRREDEAAAKGFIGGFLLGLVVGGILALIFTPRRGNETRGMVTDRASQVVDKASGLVHQVRRDQQDGQGEAAIEREFGDAVDQSQSQFAQVPEDFEG
jgi:gas vesicle protein